MTPDDRTRSALARLTENEKQCLRRRLLPQTAKEMAIDLGVSPHAVEKRLKMARAKLGLSSSLEAARLLAAVERYDPTVPQASDLAGGGGARQHPGRRIGSALIPGVIAMSLIAIILLATAQQSTPPATPEPVPTLANAKATPEQASAFLADLFASLDRDHSAYLDPRETSTLEPRDSSRDHRLAPAPAAGQPDPDAEKKWMAKLDENRDGRVSRAEYISYMMPWTLLQGVPSDWKPRG